MKNTAASVKQRLLNIAREQGEEFNLLLIRYGIERLLYRLSRSRYGDAFVLKGALLFQLWGETPHRPTRDVDLEGQGSPDPARFEKMFQEICQTEVDDDGLSFPIESIHAISIKESDEYLGTRLHLEALLGSARIKLQVDIGFGDAITPKPKLRVLPCILELSAPELRIYPWETVVAEKYQALVELGMVNSRVKDLFDLQFLAQHFDFVGKNLAQAIHATFNRRNTEMPDSRPVALTRKYTEDPSVKSRWLTFLTRSKLAAKEVDLMDVANDIWDFLEPVTEALRTEKPFAKKWKRKGPWQ